MHTGDASWAHQPSSQGHHCTTWRSSLFRAHLPRARLSGKCTFPLGYVPKLTPHTQVHTHPYRPAGTHPTGAHSLLHTCTHIQMCTLTPTHLQAHTARCTLTPANLYTHMHTHPYRLADTHPTGAHSLLHTCRHTPTGAHSFTLAHTHKCIHSPLHTCKHKLTGAHSQVHTPTHLHAHNHRGVHIHSYTPEHKEMHTCTPTKHYG